MPWNEVRPMDERLLFIADCISGRFNISQACRKYGISRKTGYKWLARYQEGGQGALRERTSRPGSSPQQTPGVIRRAIIELRKSNRFRPGPGKILSILASRHPQWQLPSRSTVYNILSREGLIQKRRRSGRVTPWTQPFLKTEHPNDVWSADFKGQFLMGNGRWCYPLTVMDHDSRYLLGCMGLEGTGTNDAQTVFKGLFKEYGLPWRIRTDNGVPFASRAVGGLSCLSIWWIRLGILPERIEPGKPQQNGRHERMHRTMKAAVARPASASMGAQQKRFDNFVRQYNEERPHEGLGQMVPASRYQPSAREMPRKLPELEYEGHMRVKRVSPAGMIFVGGSQAYIGHLLKGECVGLDEVDDGVWQVCFGPLRLGLFDERDATSSSYGYIRMKKCHPCP